jgi:hypothetical protein
MMTSSVFALHHLLFDLPQKRRHRPRIIRAAPCRCARGSGRRDLVRRPVRAAMFLPGHAVPISAIQIPAGSRDASDTDAFKFE